MNIYHLDDIPDDLKQFFQPAPQIGLEKTPEEYVAKMVALFREVHRILRKDGVLFLNLGDTYIGGGRGFDSPKQMTNKGTEGIKNLVLKPMNGLKSKDLVGIPWMVAFALRADCWYLRQDIIWHKPNPMPESVTDRCTKSHEYIFLMSKSAQYYFDNEAIKEKTGSGRNWSNTGGNLIGSGIHKQGASYKDLGEGRIHKSAKTPGQTPQGKALKRMNGQDDPSYEQRNKRSVWTVTTKPFKEAHFATFPENLIRPCILAGCPKGGIVLDPFSGAGTTALVAKKEGRNYLGIELNPKYVEMSENRINSIMF